MGRILAVERARLGISQDTLAKRVGVSRYTVGRWEAADSLEAVSGTHLRSLADLFGVSADYLLGRDGHEVER